MFASSAATVPAERSELEVERSVPETRNYKSALLGIDLGTSSVKVVAVSASGKILGLGSVEYPILTPQPGWAEQDPEQWWNATARAVRQAIEAAGQPEILAIGFSGQLHGTALPSNPSNPRPHALILPITLSPSPP